MTTPVRHTVPPHTTTLTYGEVFLRQYISTALWSELDEAGEPLDNNYGEDDLSPEAYAKMSEDCDAFMQSAEEDLNLLAHTLADSLVAAYSQAGHDFWLTRNGHGAGFWDRGNGELGDRLTALSKPYGECTLYIGVDGQLHHI